MIPLLNERIALFDSPFRRLDMLLADIEPNGQLAPIIMSVGEPQDAPPPLLAEAVAASHTRRTRTGSKNKPQSPAMVEERRPTAVSILKTPNCISEFFLSKNFIRSWVISAPVTT